jgi:hypothetical protein
VNWKGREGSCLVGGTEGNHENSQNGRLSDRIMNPSPPEYEAGVLKTRPRRSDVV